ncbi:MAG: hypothetical protein ACLRVU_09695 [Beduini sp.]|uniref:hypothetical protein n=1 Tax=Beduini sp. TaxID=1922300 RepID=UPI00399FCF13
MGKYVFSEDGSRFDAYDQIEIDERLERKSDTGHTHAYSAITGKPTTFPPSTHNHDDRYYTESEVNTKLANYKIKGDFAVTTGTIALTNGSGGATLTYPSGFNSSNCVIISIGVAFKLASAYNFGGVDEVQFNTTLGSSNISLTVFAPGMGPTATRNCKIVLMKI